VDPATSATSRFAKGWTFEQVVHTKARRVNVRLNRKTQQQVGLNLDVARPEVDFVFEE
jgi:hypothetical protein